MDGLFFYTKFRCFCFYKVKSFKCVCFFYHRAWIFSVLLCFSIALIELPFYQFMISFRIFLFFFRLEFFSFFFASIFVHFFSFIRFFSLSFDSYVRFFFRSFDFLSFKFFRSDFDSYAQTKFELHFNFVLFGIFPFRFFLSNFRFQTYFFLLINFRFLCLFSAFNLYVLFLQSNLSYNFTSHNISLQILGIYFQSILFNLLSIPPTVLLCHRPFIFCISSILIFFHRINVPFLRYHQKLITYAVNIGWIEKITINKKSCWPRRHFSEKKLFCASFQRKNKSYFAFRSSKRIKAVLFFVPLEKKLFCYLFQR